MARFLQFVIFMPLNEADYLVNCIWTFQLSLLLLLEVGNMVAQIFPTNKPLDVFFQTMINQPSLKKELLATSNV